MEVSAATVVATQSARCEVQVRRGPGDTVPLSDEATMRTLRKLMATGSVQLTERNIDVAALATRLYDNCPALLDTHKLAEVLAGCCADLVRIHPDYGLLGGRVLTSAMHRRQRELIAEYVGDAAHLGFSVKMRMCAEHTHPTTGEPYPLVRAEFAELVRRNARTLDAMVDYTRDYDYRYFGVCTLARQSYLLKLGGQGATGSRSVIESPQDMLLRYALELYRDDMRAVRECYEAASARLFTPATPSLMNAGTRHAQMSSCFLMQVPDDSLYSIYWTLLETAMISRTSGGVGLSVHNVRAAGALIKQVNGKSNGLVPMLRAYNATARYVDQGGGKRKGAFSIYIEPWHADILQVLELRKNNGAEENRARDLFYALWVPDLFMVRVRERGQWTLFSPDTAPGLAAVHGVEFVELYERYEREGRGVRTVAAAELMQRIVTSQVETGTPYMLYKDACNAKSNQRHLGTIQSSNLCTEIVQYSSADEIAVCNLCSVALPEFARYTGPRGDAAVAAASGGTDRTAEVLASFDFNALAAVVRLCVRNLNAVIDKGQYPFDELVAGGRGEAAGAPAVPFDKCRRSNERHRPMSIGVQGLADVFAELRVAYDSAEARELNRRVFECMYYAALSESCALAERAGAPHPSYEGSPVSHGELQFDAWPGGAEAHCHATMFDWPALRERIARHGVRNSLLIGLMPTASTSQILGNTESFEPPASNMYTRRTLAGTFTVPNRRMVEQLGELGLWDERMRATLMATRGSLQRVICVPRALRDTFKTAYEVRMRDAIDAAADRGAFVDQSQSFNVHMAGGDVAAKLPRMHAYAWRRGLKTGMYYLRTTPAVHALAVTTDAHLVLELDDDDNDSATAAAAAAPGAASGDASTTPVVAAACKLGDEGCISCGS